MKKRYWLFISSEYEVRPAMQDYIGDFDNIQRALDRYNKDNSVGPYSTLICRIFDFHSGIQYDESGESENTSWILFQ